MMSQQSVSLIEVQALIDAAIQPLQAELDASQAAMIEAKANFEAAIVELDDLLKCALKTGDRVALQSDNKMFVCAEQGGPAKAGEPYNLTGRDSAGGWESFTLHRG